MKIYVLLALVAVVSSAEFDVLIFDSAGNDITNNENYNAWVGDYIYCKFDGQVIGPRIYYGWLKYDDGNPINKEGPNFISFPNEVDNSNRLYIGMTLGNGNPISYKCVASDVDPYENRETYTGANIRFTVSQPPYAGQLFPERDYAVKTGETIDLMCKRMNSAANVTWETVDLGGNQVDLIYDGGDDPMGNYELVGQDDDDFTLRITMTEDTAIFHRCSVTYNTLTDVSATAMLFKLDLPNPCTAVNLGAANDVGDLIELGGCGVTVFHNDAAEITSDISVLTFWQESNDGGENIGDFDTSRTLDGVSTHTVLANLESDGQSFYCGVQVYREQASVIRAHVDSVCEDTFTLTVNEDTHAFHVFYGSEEPIDFDVLSQRKTELKRDGDLFCDLDAKPEPADDDTVLIHVKAPGGDAFEPTPFHYVLAADIVVGAAYKCVFFDESADATHESGILYIIEGIVQVAIYNSAGDLLDSNSVYDVASGDYLECRPIGAVNPDHVPNYLWHRSIQVQNVNGPKQMIFGNTDQEYNRLPISYELGLGETIGYQCIGSDIFNVGLIDMMGTLVRFRAALTDSTKAGIAFTPADKVGFEDDEVTLACTRNAAEGVVIFETHNEAGETIDLLYDSSEPGTDPPIGYVMDAEGDNFVLTIIINQARSRLTRCTITEDPKDTVTATAMIYTIQLEDVCMIDDSLDGVDAGTTATMGGCNVEVTHHDSAGDLGGTFTVMTYWQQGTTFAPNQYNTVDESRALDVASTHTVRATADTHNNIYTCGVQVHRENSVVVPATKNNICETYGVTVNENSVGFRIYYGIRDQMDDDDYVTFNVLEQYLTEIVPNAAITCEVDRYPSPTGDQVVTIEYSPVDSEAWMDFGSHIVPPESIVIDTEYRCAFRDAEESDNDSESGNVIFITGVVETEITDSQGVTLPTNVNQNLNVGDYIVCKSVDPINAKYPPKFLWRRSEKSPLPNGPRHILYKNEDDHTNRLYINHELGQGTEIVYSCIGTDDLTIGQPSLMGTTVRFTAETTDGVAGTVFPSYDHAGLADTTVSLTCSRAADQGRVIWQAIDTEGNVVVDIYDTEVGSPPDPSTGYEINESGLDVELVITYSQTTAIKTRCTVSEPMKATVEATSMIYLIEFTSDGCEEDGLSVDLPVGEEVTFSGCSVSTSISPLAGQNVSPYTTITFWQQSDSANGEYTVIESTRTLDGESVYTVPATADSHGMFYSCGAQVHREGTLVVAAVADNICSSPYEMTVADNSVGFRVYYGVRDEMDDDDYIRFDTLQRYTTEKLNNAALTCEVDGNPEPGSRHEVLMQFQAPNDNDWQDANDNIIPESQVDVGTKYRCAYIDPDSVNDESGVVFVIQVFHQTQIFLSNGDPVENTEYDFVENDYVECRTSTPYPFEYLPKFVWYRNNQVDNVNGPKLLRYQNTDDEHNRLPINMFLGEGELIQYNCIGVDVIPTGLPDFMGAPVKFRAVPMTSLDPAGESFSPQELVGMADQTVDLECQRNNNGGKVLWETILKNGDPVMTIYDSDEGGNAADDYEIIGDNDNEFNLRITVKQSTAILTRCTVTEDGLADVSSTAMIYFVERIADGDCTSDASGTPDVGDKIELSGCDANILVSDQSDIENEDYQAVMFWTQKSSGSDVYTILDESRVLEKESVYTIEALTELHDAMWQCGIQISRPQVLSTSVVVSDICINEPHLQLTDDDVRFRIYYGDRSEMDYEQFIDFPASAVDVGKTDNGDLTCEIDRHPAPANDDDWFLQSRVGADGDWSDEEDVIPSGQIEIGSHYRCLFRDTDGEDSFSHILRIVDGINTLEEVLIFNSNGTELDETTVNTLFEGDYLECRPAENFATIADYAWVKSTYSNAVGPNIVQVPKEAENGYNRLYVYNNFGEGEDIGYRCISTTNFGWGFTELLGTRVLFRVLESDEDPTLPPGDGGASNIQVSLVCVGAAFVAYINNLF